MKRTPEQRQEDVATAIGAGIVLVAVVIWMTKHFA